jgi:chloramphenicol-sensitive protein RarD
VEAQKSLHAVNAGGLYALAAYGTWGFAPIYWRALDEIPAPEILAHRALWSLLTGATLVIVLGRTAELRRVLRSRRHLLPMLASSLLIGTNWGVFLWAVETDRVLATSLGYYINPLISILLGTLILGERLRPGQKFAVALAAIGVAQLAWSFGRLPWISIVLAISFGLYGLVRKVAPVLPVGLAYLWFARQGGATIGFEAPPETLLLLAGSGAFTAVPLLCFNSAAKRLKLSTIGLFQYLAPSIAFVIAVALYDEPFTRPHAITFACVWAALAIYTLDTLRANRGS